MLGITGFDLAQDLVNIPAPVRRRAFDDLRHLRQKTDRIELTKQFAKATADSIQKSFLAQSEAALRSVRLKDEPDLKSVFSTTAGKFANDSGNFKWFCFCQIEVDQLAV